MEPEPADSEWTKCVDLARSRGLQAVRLTADQVDAKLIGSMPHEVLLNYLVLPLTIQDFELTLAMADPFDVVAEDVMRQISGCRVLPVVAMASQIRAALEGRLGVQESPIESLLSQIPSTDDIVYLEAEPDDKPADETDQVPEAPIIQLVNSIIGDAIRMGASDVHLEPQTNCVRVRYRLDGSLKTMVELPKRVQSSCLSRLKLMSGIDISESRKPQDGRARALVDGRKVDLRVSSLPTFWGESLVLRILDPKAVLVDLDRLGLSPSDFARLQSVLAASQGMILCTGPTGSGKTSTLYAALRQLNGEAEKLITVEDPVEYEMGGINQVQVNVRAGLTFSGALRSILRQDPDVLLIGEIRDLETAEIAVQAAQTGHLVLSTLHTNDALSTLGRLVLIGVAPFLLASSLLCVIAQRLVRRLCPHCCKPGPASAGALRLLALAQLDPPENMLQPVGCKNCRQQGYKGRLGLFEMLLISDRLREMLLAGNSEKELELVARQEGMRSLLEDGLAKCALGHTSLDEVLRVVTVRQVGGRLCPACSATVPGGLGICVQCGAQLDLHCPKCQTVVQANWRFCPGCRGPLKPVSPPPPAAEEAAQPASQPGQDAAPASVLVLSAEPDLGQRLEPLLKHKLWQACSQSQALELIDQHHPKVLVLDYETPGLQAERLIEQLHRAAQTRVLLLMEAGEEGVKGLDCGADEFLLKPMDELRVSSKITQMLEREP
jgi:type IV pilus assembly protein PilB